MRDLDAYQVLLDRPAQLLVARGRGVYLDLPGRDVEQHDPQRAARVRQEVVADAQGGDDQRQPVLADVERVPLDRHHERALGTDHGDTEHQACRALGLAPRETAAPVAPGDRRA